MPEHGRVRLKLPASELTRCTRWKVRASHVHKLRVIAAERCWTMELALDRAFKIGLHALAHYQDKQDELEARANAVAAAYAVPPPVEAVSAPPPIPQPPPVVEAAPVASVPIPEPVPAPAGLVTCSVGCGRVLPIAAKLLHEKNCQRARNG